jgi:hypothetical protein
MRQLSDLIASAPSQEERQRQGMNDFLDKMIDGEPVHIVMTPGLRRALRKRRAERMFEDAQDYREIADRFRR